jgi:acetyl-CoA carboxylase carboxyltransferase component
MGLEGAVRLGYRRELAAAEDPDALFDELVARAYERGRALSAATVYEIDDVIDPAETRRWIGTALRSASGSAPSAERRVPLDTW